MAGLILDELQIRLAASLLYLLTSTVPPFAASTLPPETWESKHQPETLQTWQYQKDATKAFLWQQRKKRNRLKSTPPSPPPFAKKVLIKIEQT